MKTCIYICDTCGKEIKKDHYYITIAGTKTYYDFDLCPECAELLVSTLCKYNPEMIEGDKAPDEPTLEKEEPKDGLPELRVKKVDYGKALALHNAGWNSYQIAQDMRISVQEAAEAVKKAKSKVFS